MILIFAIIIACTYLTLKRGVFMNLDKFFIGLPMKTWIINGGLFVFSALAPTIVAVILKNKKELDDE